MRLVVGAALLAAALALLGAPYAAAEGGSQAACKPPMSSAAQPEDGPRTTLSPIGNGMAVERTVLQFYAPADNTLPWAYVRGAIANHVPDYPVIIQMYSSDGDPVHFAQVGVDEEGQYEYRFRVRDVQGDAVINVFEGQYAVKIFKVVYLGGLERV